MSLTLGDISNWSEFAKKMFKIMDESKTLGEFEEKAKDIKASNEDEQDELKSIWEAAFVELEKG